VKKDGASARRSEGRHFGRYISQLYWRTLANLTRELRPLGVSARTYPILLSLFHGDGRSQEELARNIGVDKAAVKRAVDELVADGFAVRDEHESDGRAYRVRLTDKARMIEARVEGALHAWEGRLLGSLSGPEREAAGKLLAIMAANAASAAVPPDS
jgi:DNA-binding MarR family transcriptional regulator